MSEDTNRPMVARFSFYFRHRFETISVVVDHQKREKDKLGQCDTDYIRALDLGPRTLDIELRPWTEIQDPALWTLDP